MQIFRTIKNDVTGANESIGLFGKSADDLKNIFTNIKEKGLKEAIFNNPSIDVNAINEYNNAIAAGRTREEALANARTNTNQATIELMESTDGAIENVEELAHSTTLAGKAGSMATKAISTLGNMAAFAVISGVVQLAATAIDNWIHRVDRANEAMQEAVSEYETTKSNLQNINSELEENKQRITELQAKGPLTYVEKGELAELQEITKELLLQKDIEERRAAAASKKAAEKTIDAYDEQYGIGEISQDNLDDEIESQELMGTSYMSVGEEDVVGNLAALQRAKDKQSQRQQDYDKAKNNGEDTKWLESDLQMSIDEVDEIEARLDSSIADLQEKRMALKEEYQKAMEKKDLGEEPLTSFEQNTIQSYDSITDSLKLLYEKTDPNAWNNMAFADIFETEGIEKTKEDLIEMAKLGTLTTESLSDCPNLYNAILDNDLLRQDGQTIAETFLDQILGLAEAEEKLNGSINTEPLSFEDTAAQIQSLSEGMNMIDQIYADVSDQGAFDWSSILNNEGFKETFGGFTEEYENFIKTISNAPDDVGACQSAFDDLTSAYLNSSGIMDNLTAETKDMTVTMLEQMGVSNAQEIVTNRLSAEEAFLAEKKQNSAIASRNLSTATWQEIAAVANEGNASESTKAYLIQLAMSKLSVSNHPINTDADINAIIAIANAAGASAEYVTSLQTALSNLQTANTSVENAKNAKNVTGIAKIRDIRLAEAEQRAAQKEVDNLTKNLKNNLTENALDPTDFHANFGGNAPAATDTSGSSGGGSSAGSSPAGSSAPEAQETMEEAFEETFNWLERRLKNLQHIFDKWIKQAEAALTGRFINKYYKKAEKSLKKELNTNAKSYDFYMNKAKESGLDESYAKKVRNGTLDVETVTDKKLAEQIKDYQEWYDKATEAADSFLETAEKLYNLPLEKAAAKIELFKNAITLLDKQLDNAIGSNAKNSLLGQKDRQEQKTFNAQQNALNESKKNLKKSARDIRQPGALSGSGLSAKQQKKVKKDVKNRQEIDISKFKKGSKAYKKAVKYNEALKAKQEAKYQRDLAKEELAAWERESAKQKFDNISDDYKKKIQLTSHQLDAKDNEISLLTAAGKKVDRSLYESQISIQQQLLTQYQAQQSALAESLKTIPAGTDEWHDANNEIQQLNASITNCSKEILEINNAINQLRFDQFKEMAESIERVIAEQEFLQNLFSHEKTTDSETGQYTKAGLAKLGSLATSWIASKEKADNSQTLLKELQEVKELGKQEDGSYKLGDWKFNSLEDLEAKIKETYTTWQSDIKETYSLESSLADLKAEQYKAELNAVKDLIDAKKKALSSEKDLHDYQKSIQEKTDDISAIQKQIIAYSGDSSEEGLAKLQKLQKDLADRQEDLAETEYDRYISDQQDMLDKLYTEYEETITKKIDDFDANVQAALKLANENTALIAAYLSENAKKNGYAEENKELFEKYQKKLQDYLKTLDSEAEQSPETEQKPKTEQTTKSEQKPVTEKPTGLKQPIKQTWTETVRSREDIRQAVLQIMPQTVAKISSKNNMLVAPASADAQLNAVSGSREVNRVVNISTLTLPNVTNYEEFKDKMFHDMQNSPKFENLMNGITVNKIAGKGRLDKYRYKL